MAPSAWICLSCVDFWNHAEDNQPTKMNLIRHALDIELDQEHVAESEAG